MEGIEQIDMSQLCNVSHGLEPVHVCQKLNIIHAMLHAWLYSHWVNKVNNL